MPPSPIKLIAIDIDGTLLPLPVLRLASAIAEHCLKPKQPHRDCDRDGAAAGYATPLVARCRVAAGDGLHHFEWHVTRSLGGERIDRMLLPVETAIRLCPVLREFGGTTVFTFDAKDRESWCSNPLTSCTRAISLWVDANRTWIKEFSSTRACL